MDLVAKAKPVCGVVTRHRGDAARAVWEFEATDRRCVGARVQGVNWRKLINPPATLAGLPDASIYPAVRYT